ncbi:hypothetical protein AQPE_0776 [Aquipluma nitroreducens]|uniref:Uncharacterized protein n=1 Tax=Aquipluma nitroreducens TaxID=2010828 RepID=A0A5K7S535_9BACT|nr:hypothetical protein AQPE_0776 [Aquipluma nitroreducens]
MPVVRFRYKGGNYFLSEVIEKEILKSQINRYNFFIRIIACQFLKN